jgi:hypothetical protein
MAGFEPMICNKLLWISRRVALKIWIDHYLVVGRIQSHIDHDPDTTGDDTSRPRRHGMDVNRSCLKVKSCFTNFFCDKILMFLDIVP